MSHTASSLHSAAVSCLNADFSTTTTHRKTIFSGPGVDMGSYMVTHPLYMASPSLIEVALPFPSPRSFSLHGTPPKRGRFNVGSYLFRYNYRWKHMPTWTPQITPVGKYVNPNRLVWEDTPTSPLNRSAALATQRGAREKTLAERSSACASSC